MINKSIWCEEMQKNICSELNRNIEVDVLIIGGGITGINTAYQLINSNLKMFRYELIWEKERATNFMFLKKQFGQCTENISVFYITYRNR